MANGMGASALPLGTTTAAPRATAGASDAVGDFARSVYEVARKDVLQHIRTKRLLIIGIFFLVILQLVTMVFPLVFEVSSEDPPPGSPSHENQLLHFHFNAAVFGGLFAIQLLVIVLTADAVCSEWGQRTIFLLLSKPVSRSAFVVGKYLGALVSTLPLLLVIYVAQYLLMMAVYPGQPTGDEVLGFVATLAVLCLGTAVIAAFALLMSSLTRSNVMALVLSLLAALFIFPILGAISDIQMEVDQANAFRDGEFTEDEAVDPDAWKYDWSHYVNPGGTLASAPGHLIEGDEGDDFALGGLIPTGAPKRAWLALLTGVGYIALFVGLSLLRVNRRNFE